MKFGLRLLLIKKLNLKLNQISEIVFKINLSNK